ncbi:MAG: (S)-ureidoglycine aminohydrolase [Thermaerobacterales bacterium]
MTKPLQSRAVVRRNFMLLEPSGFCRSALPAWPGCTVHILASPAMGAGFCHYLITIPPGCGTAKDPAAKAAGGSPEQTFIYCLAGSAVVELSGVGHAISPGCYVYMPPDSTWSIDAEEQSCKILLFRHPYRSIDGLQAWSASGEISKLTQEPQGRIAGSGSFLQAALPEHPAFDLKVNILSFAPGDSHSQIETHHETHGLYMLSGEGLYYLDGRWYPVAAGDYMWMGPFLPQAFYATGEDSASYIYTKEGNRDIQLPDLDGDRGVS